MIQTFNRDRWVVIQVTDLTIGTFEIRQLLTIRLDVVLSLNLTVHARE